MQLYQLDSLVAKTSLLAFSNSIFSTSSVASLLVGGLNSNGQCTIVTNAGGSFFDTYDTCASLSFYCQFMNSNRKFLLREIKCLVVNESFAATSVPVQPTKTPAVCVSSQDLYSSAGVYFKSVCYVSSAKTYTEASNFCKLNDMKIYNAATPQAQASLISYSYSLTCNGLPWNNFVSALGSQQCSSLYYDGKGFSVTSVPCTNVYNFFCEFINPSRKFD